jgi:hypothetical protein
LVAPSYTSELGDQAICHRNVTHDGTEGVFISTRLLGDRFALAFEFFINVGHAFVDVIGVPEAFDQLVWGQALADVRGETSQDAWESRNLSLAAKSEKIDGKPTIDEKARNNFLESAFSDAVAIYQLAFGRLRLLQHANAVPTSGPSLTGYVSSPASSRLIQPLVRYPLLPPRVTVLRVGVAGASADSIA